MPAGSTNRPFGNHGPQYRRRLRVESVAVDWMPPRLELPGHFPAAERGQAHAEQVGGLADRQQVGRADLLLPCHMVDAIQR